MSDLYNRIEHLCEKNNMTITSMCKVSGASRASLTDLKVGRKQKLSTLTLSRIAKTMGVTVGYLLGEEPKWEDAIEHFGFCWEASYREEQKGAARTIFNNPDSTDGMRDAAQFTIFKALFSRSLEASGYSLDHVDLPTYISMILNQGEGRHSIPSDVYQRMVSKYGKKPGISKGTYYIVTAKASNSSTKPDVLDEVDIAFYGEYKQLTEDDKDTIRDMVRIMRERRAKKQE